jgi:uncharacterized protein (TIGR03085 family)
MTASLARRERHALCDLALLLGPDAPTLSAGWDARDLVAHLLVRELSPLGAAGIVVPPLAGLTERAMDRWRRRDFAVAVERLRDPRLTPYAVPPVERALNTFEFVVHHEDLRRGQPDWEPRELPAADLDTLWGLLRSGGRWLGRALPAPVVLRRTDSGAETTVRRGEDPVIVSGPVVELTLFLFGRSSTRGLTFDGPPEAVAAVRSADLGI